VGVGLERPATEKNAQGNGRRIPSRGSPTVITKEGQKEEVTGPTVGMYLTTDPSTDRRGEGVGRKEGRKEAKRRRSEVDVAWKLKLSCGPNVISDAYFFKRKEAFSISSPRTKKKRPWFSRAAVRT